MSRETVTQMQRIGSQPDKDAMMMPMTYAEAADILDTAKVKCETPEVAVVYFEIDADSSAAAEARLADAIAAAIHALRRAWNDAAGDRARIAEGGAR